jgi:hypothetical protein
MNNVLIKKSTYDYEFEIKDIIKLLQFKKEPIKLKGSYTIEHLKYFSDYDIETVIKKKYTHKEIFEEFYKILSDILKQENLFFIELKIELMDGDKIRFYPDDTFSFDKFKDLKDIDFIKIDLVGFINNEFIEISSIYLFNLEFTNIKTKLKNDIKKYSDENNYYKVIKRTLSLAKINKDEKMINDILLFLNNLDESHILRNLETIKLMEKYYSKDKNIMKKIDLNLNEKNINKKDINNLINKYSTLINKKSKIFSKALI